MTSPLYIVGVDGSEWSARAARLAVSLAGETGAEVLFYHVLEAPRVPFLAEGGAYIAKEGNYDAPAEAQKMRRQAEAEILAPLAGEYAESGVTIQTGHDWGDPRQVLHDLVRERRARMIFLGRRGRSTFADLVIGSVSNALAHHAGVPIVLVP